MLFNFAFFEVKTSVSGKRGALKNKSKIDQRDGPERYVPDRLQKAANKNWLGQADKAKRISNEIEDQMFDSGLEGYVVHITHVRKEKQSVEFYKWVPGKRLGEKIDNTRI
ncbi:hypothetical protein [Pelagibaculum spongiae]|uniref:Uncharacterized protein n=1 Tax=Pelagibaculum spongiae TaxID=2080658 RepID=A0A2V1GQ68_9GAMM|nr:hypothetical protein [Pelagibaculum spongiae]PVZ65612.1 hypothetical protein DC094_17145 [Pelagibaculum spongiae]